MKLVIASNNQGKIKEVKKMLSGLDVQVVSLDDEGIDIDVEETGTTFEENAVLKAETIGKITQTLVLADDSGIVVDALDGRPGVYSKRYGNSDEERNQKLLEELKDVPKEKRTARFMAVLAVYNPASNTTKTFEGKVEGLIADQLDGVNGFGYDPVFFSTELGKSFGQATSEEKNNISHRGRALTLAIKYIQSLLED